MKKYAGLWIDNKRTMIALSQKEEITMLEISSHLDSKHAKGGAGSSTPYGPQDAISESKVMERRKHQIQEYFSDIMGHLKSYEYLVFFGPGDTKEKLRSTLLNSHDFRNATIATETCGRVTTNQLKANTKKHFERKYFKIGWSKK